MPARLSLCSAAVNHQVRVTAFTREPQTVTLVGKRRGISAGVHSPVPQEPSRVAVELASAFLGWNLQSRDKTIRSLSDRLLGNKN